MTGANASEESPDLAREEFPLQSESFWVSRLQEPGPVDTVEFEESGRYANPMGTLHGGVLCDIADAAMGAAYRSALFEIFCARCGTRT